MFSDAMTLQTLVVVVVVVVVAPLYISVSATNTYIRRLPQIHAILSI